uniref:Uncharacterized protein n=1 Tax=Timema poppense TaxID=170557 RepID=A0A7R9DE91_TIMPO|nr:unnamed protein product [Timema poppensis]
MKRSHDGKITTFFKAKQRQSKEQCPDRLYFNKDLYIYIAGADDCNLLQHQDGINETFSTSSGDKISLSQFEANNTYESSKGVYWVTKVTKKLPTNCKEGHESP